MAKVSLLQAITTALTPKTLSPVGAGNRWSNLIREPFTGAWQQNKEISVDTAAANRAVYACVTLISSDFGKLRPRIIEREKAIWVEKQMSAFAPVLRRPNRYQNYIQFQEWWMTSKLLRGNTYALKQRDARGMVSQLYILDPDRVMPLVADDGSIFYQLGNDNLSGVQEASLIVPASEIIHDRMNCLFHPLVGTSPLFAAAAAANAGLKMQDDAISFFSGGARPGGILTAPGAISDGTAQRLKDYFELNFSGNNRGKIAVVGDDLKFAALRMNSTDAQLIEQMQYSDQVVCSAFHVPPFKVQIGTIPTGMKVGDMNQIYYSDCLQSLIENYELCLIEGLGLTQEVREVNLDLEGLLRMDPTSQADLLVKLVGGTIMKPNEARNRLNLSDIEGGDTVYSQVQNFSLAALAKRDEAAPAPDTSGGPAPAATPEPDDDPVTPEAQEQARELLEYLKKGLSNA